VADQHGIVTLLVQLAINRIANQDRLQGAASIETEGHIMREP
jgi:hypothetical protein